MESVCCKGCGDHIAPEEIRTLIKYDGKTLFWCKPCSKKKLPLKWKHEMGITPESKLERRRRIRNQSLGLD